jgi:glycosyltransferase involved in cell wall biosynthesis
MIFISATSLSTFVKKDIEILGNIDEVRCFIFNPSRKIYTPLIIIRQAIVILWNIRRIRLLVCMFAAYHAIIPAILGKIFRIPFIVIVGGVDAVAYPSFRYGYFQNRLIRPFVQWTYKLATAISTKDESLWWFEDQYYGKDFPFQGIDYFMPGLKARKNVIYNGFDIKRWYYDGIKTKKHFVTIAGGWQYGTAYMLKGIDLLVAAARSFPDCHFEIIGVSKTDILKDLPENIKITGFIDNRHLPEYIGRSEFYLQLSISEGFPNALCEAMLCRCIPIVSDVAAMPKIVGETGFILKKRDIQLLEALIRKALQLSDQEREALGQEARARIIRHFPIERRARELTELVVEVCPAYRKDGGTPPLTPPQIRSAKSY